MKNDDTASPTSQPSEPKPKPSFSQFWWVFLVILGALGLLIVLWLNGTF
jgi:hypothetical protein